MFCGNFLLFIKKKFYRLISSKNYLKIIKLYHDIFKEKFRGELNINDIYDSSVHRKSVINDIINIKKYKSYLEIGCDKDQVFAHVNLKEKYGVDPVSGGNFRGTSDSFFKNNKKNFDLIFIDGLHEYEQVKKDIDNSLNFLNSNGIILIHDCLPINYYEQAVPRCSIVWKGNVWKALVEKRIDENIDTYVGAFDQGIGLIIKRKNKNILSIKKNIQNLSYEDYCSNYENFLNIISYKEFMSKIYEC